MMSMLIKAARKGVIMVARTRTRRMLMPQPQTLVKRMAMRMAAAVAVVQVAKAVRVTMTMTVMTRKAEASAPSLQLVARARRAGLAAWRRPLQGRREVRKEIRRSKSVHFISGTPAEGWHYTPRHWVELTALTSRACTRRRAQTPRISFKLAL